MKKFGFIAVMAIMAFTTIFTSCNSAVGGDDLTATEKETGTAFVIKLPGEKKQTQRELYSEADATSYEIKLLKDSEVVTTKTGEPGDTVRLVVEADGAYTINVTAKMGEVIIAEGSETASIELDKGDVAVKVTLTPKQKDAGFNVDIGWNDSEEVMAPLSAITINGVQLEKTAEVHVMNSAVTVTGANNTNNYYGVFIEGRTVTLSPFIMGKYEVTQELYKTVMANQKVTVGGVEKTLNAEPFYCKETGTYPLVSGEVQKLRPAEGMTWYDAVYFCNVLTEKTMKASDKAYNITVTEVDSDGNITGATVTLVEGAKGYRLPTEAEWEFAARGGDQTKADWNYIFSGADTASGTSYSAKSNTGLDAVGWYCYNTLNSGITGTKIPSSEEHGGSHEVGKKASNALGLYDMSGNVWEWCYDWYGSVSTGSVINPTGALSGSYRVERGGSWSEEANFSSVCNRYVSRGPQWCYFILGFRVVRSAQ